MSEKIVTVGDQQVDIRLERNGSRIHAGEHELEVLQVREDEIELEIAGERHLIPYAVQGSTISFSFRGEIWFAEVADRSSRTRQRHRDHSTTAPMPGVVLKILVNEGDRVAKGSALLILEAMKMEHAVVAPRDGTVLAVNCSEGEMVQPGVELVTFAPAEG